MLLLAPAWGSSSPYTNLISLILTEIPKLLAVTLYSLFAAAEEIKVQVTRLVSVKVICSNDKKVKF